MRYQHIVTYDPEELDKFLFDNKAEKTGVDYACEIIHNEVNQMLKGRPITTMDEIDGLLNLLYHKKLDN
jgi:hypothetical protein